MGKEKKKRKKEIKENRDKGEDGGEDSRALLAIQPEGLWEEDARKVAKAKRKKKKQSKKKKSEKPLKARDEYVEELDDVFDYRKSGGIDSEDEGSPDQRMSAK